MLLSLTPNPTIDRMLIVPNFRSAEVCRVVESYDTAGGKGLNVARVMTTLGKPVLACGPLGGETGRRIAALAAVEGLPARWSWLASGASRTCTIVLDPATPDTLVLNEPGPRVEPSDWATLELLVREELSRAAAIAVCGSLPPGVAVKQFTQLLNELDASLPVFLDTSGPALRAALSLPLALLKISASELGDVLGCTILSYESARDAALQVQAQGPRAVMITLGKAGAVAVGADGAWWASPPPALPISPLGSGDALLAGVATTLIDGGELAEALRMGVACGTANTLAIGAGVLRAEDVFELHATTSLTRL